MTINIDVTRQTATVAEPANNAFVVWYDPYDEPYAVYFRSDANGEDECRWFNADQHHSGGTEPSAWDDLCEELYGNNGPHLLVPAAKVDELTAELAKTRTALTEANRQRTVAEAATEALKRDNEGYATQVDQANTVVEVATALREYIRTGETPVHINELVAAVDALQKVEGNDQFLIWSNHHKSWWGPSGCGYHRDITRAGRYALADTKKWLGRGCGCCAVPEVVIPAAKVVGAGDRSVRGVITAATRAAVKAGQVNRYYEPAEVAS